MDASKQRDDNIKVGNLRGSKRNRKVRVCAWADLTLVLEEEGNGQRKRSGQLPVLGSQIGLQNLQGEKNS